MARFLGAVTALLLVPAVAQSELLGIVSYESKPDTAERKEGIAILDLDPKSPRFGQILEDMPLPGDLVAHHIYFSPDAGKAYITALGKPELRVMDVATRRMKVIDVPDCQVGEDVAFSAKTGLWYQTCMGSSTVIVGDLKTDKVLRTIRTPAPYPHGIAIHDGIDRMLLTSTVKPDLKDSGEVIQEIRLSDEAPIANHKVSNKPSPSGAAPVEVTFIPGTDPPAAYTTVMNEGTLWYGTWQPEAERFAWKQVADLAAMGQGLPLEPYVNEAGDRLYVTTAQPGHFNVFDISDRESPRLLKSVATAGGAHHVAFSPDGQYAFVQNSFINLPEMHDGSISVVDLNGGRLVASIDTLKNKGLTPNNVALFPEGAARQPEAASVPGR